MPQWTSQGAHIIVIRVSLTGDAMMGINKFDSEGYERKNEWVKE